MIIITLVFILISVVILSLIAFIFQLNLLGVLGVCLIVGIMFFFIYLYYEKRNIQELINKNFEYARHNLLNNSSVMIVILNGNKVLWGNDNLYSEFPILLKKRNIQEINYNGSKTFEYHNNIYKIIEKNDGMIFFQNVTSDERYVRKLEEMQASVGNIELDNYTYLESNLSNSEFINLISNLSTDLIKYFSKYNMFYEEKEKSTFSFTIPHSELKKQMESKFEDLNEIARKYHVDGYEITFSVGIGTNQHSIKQNGIACKEAFNLAVTRGGGQVVVFDADNRKYYAGFANTIKGSLRLKARIHSNTISNLLQSKDVVYLFTHKNPDSDALGSMFLLKKLIRHLNNDISIKVMVDNNIETTLQEQINKIGKERIFTNTVVDKTKKNIAFVCDTQSTQYIANKNVFDDIIDVVIIDHHQSPIEYISNPIFSWVETNSSSTTEMITEMLITKNVSLDDKNIANLGIQGILTDSLNLKYRTDANTLDVMSYLVTNGGRIDKALSELNIDKEIFKEKQKIFATIKFNDDIAILKTKNDNDILMSMSANEALEIKDINISLIYYEVSEYDIKIKLRSIQSINVKNVIEKYGGGGHPQQAAGIIQKNQLENLINDLKGR